MTHPILGAAALIDTALTSVADTNPTFMSTVEKATALTELVRLESRVAELRLRVMADDGDVAESTAAHDVAEWLTVQARIRHEDARSDLALARALDRRYSLLATALRDGAAVPAQAQVIARSLDGLPAEVSTDVLALAESTLVAHVAGFGPRQLAKLGRHLLDVIAPEIAEGAEARRLTALEADAHRRTRLALRRVGDGTTRLSGLLPDAAASRLATYLEAFTNPRHVAEGSMSQECPHDTVGTRDALARLPYPRRLGQAFCQLLETLDPGRLPIHGGDATTVIVTIPFASLLAEVGSAQLIGSHVPGDDSGDRITAGQARRLACAAGIIPAVLGGQSEVLDLGRSRRLFSPAQRRALRLRDRTCRAEGCDIPAPWCEAHHAGHPWSRGGETNLDEGLLLCHHHHQRAHDTSYRTERLPNGDLRYHRRR